MSVVPMPLFDPLDSIWDQDPATMPRDPNSDQMVAWLVAQTQTYPVGFGTGKIGMPIYYVRASQPRLNVSLRVANPDSFDNVDLVKRFALNADGSGGVPIPTGSVVQADSDACLVIVCEETNEMWEMWQAQQAADGTWSARWGGHVPHMDRAKGYYVNLFVTEADAAANRNALMRSWWGCSASGLMLGGGEARWAELDLGAQSGYIGHALAGALRMPRRGVHAAPAQRNDGRSTDEFSIPEGAWLGLNPDYDCSQLPFPMNVYALAVQRHGYIICDQTLAGTSVRTQSATSAGVAPMPIPSAVVRTFPWDQLYVVSMDLRTSRDDTHYVLGAY